MSIFLSISNCAILYIVPSVKTVPWCPSCYPVPTCRMCRLRYICESSVIHVSCANYCTKCTYVSVCLLCHKNNDLVLIYRCTLYSVQCIHAKYIQYRQLCHWIVSAHGLYSLCGTGPTVSTVLLLTHCGHRSHGNPPFTLLFISSLLCMLHGK